MRIVHPSRTIDVAAWTDFNRALDANVDATTILPAASSTSDAAIELSTCVDTKPSRLVIGGARSLEDVTVFGNLWEGFLWVIVNSVICRVPLDLDETAWLDLERPVSEARILSDLGILVAVCDVQVSAVNKNMDLKWSVSTDIIADFEWNEEFIRVEQMDSPTFEIQYQLGGKIA